MFFFCFRAVLHLGFQQWRTFDALFVPQIDPCGLPASAALSVFALLGFLVFLSFFRKRNYIRPPPPPPISGQKAFSRGGGWGCIF